MADFYPLISGAVAQLPENTAAARRALYERVRGMLVKQLRSANPEISATEIERELNALEEAIDRIEDEAGPLPDAGRMSPPTPAGPRPSMPMAAARPTTMPEATRRARAGGAKRIAIGIIVVAGALAGAYFMYARLSSPAGPPVAAVPAGGEAIAITGLLAGFRGAAEKPANVLLLHVRCGATLVELDAGSNPANPSGHVDEEGRFSIVAKRAYVGEIVKVGVRATTTAPDDPKRDFLVLGFFAGDKLELLTGADGKTIKISPQGEILNAAALRILSVIPPALIVTRKPDGNIYASGGAMTFDEAC